MAVTANDKNIASAPKGTNPQIAAGQAIAEPLLKIIVLEQAARQATTLKELGYIAVNDTHRLVPYFQAYFWQISKTGLKLETISGVSRFDPNAPLVKSVLKMIRRRLKKKEVGEVHQFDTQNSVQKGSDNVRRLDFPGNALWCPFKVKEQTSAGLVLFRENEFTGPEIARLEMVINAYAYSWKALGGGSKKTSAMSQIFSKKFLLLVILSIVALMMLPVKESVLAPSNIVPYKPTIVSAPISGVVDRFLVSPNERVIKDQLLFTLDDTELKSEYEVAEKELESMRAEYLTSAQKAFADETEKSRIEYYKARVAQRALERDLALSRLERTRVRAERDGIAVFTDENDWLGEPVEVGQKVMSLAEPDNNEIEIWMPVEDAVYFEPGAEVQLFLNTDPTQPVLGKLRLASYEPQENQLGELAYKLKASIEDQDFKGRIGWRGTAKVTSETKISLFYYLFRRPISVVRQYIGF